MPAVCRITDEFSCSDKVATGSGNVFVNGLPAARLTDSTTGHPCPPGGSGTAPPSNIVTGSSRVFVNGLPIARLTDSLDPHKCSGSSSPHSGILVTGSSNVFSG